VAKAKEQEAAQIANSYEFVAAIRELHDFRASSGHIEY
jgi:hypothetical protein